MTTYKHCIERALAAILIVGGTSSFTAAPSSAVWHAHAGRTLNGAATARLHLIKAEGSQLIEEGQVTGALAGTAHGTFHAGAVFVGAITIHTRGGSISGEGRAIPSGSGRYQSFRGLFQATGGSGLYTHVSGRAGLYGVLDRRHDSVVIQTTGRLTY
ncbi:MAG TPA: hypothetical protein VGN25_01645 [Solirubrobacteraceae bacterium]|jgi:hypothetical protein|nr:hypothetical protein [Solirubrobacteraceae bacterium]